MTSQTTIGAGKPLSSQTCEIIFNVFSYFMKNIKKKGQSIDMGELYNLTATATGAPKDCIEEIVRDKRSPDSTQSQPARTSKKSVASAATTKKKRSRSSAAPASQPAELADCQIKTKPEEHIVEVQLQLAHKNDSSVTSDRATSICQPVEVAECQVKSEPEEQVVDVNLPLVLTNSEDKDGQMTTNGESVRVGGSEYRVKCEPLEYEVNSPLSLGDHDSNHTVNTIPIKYVDEPEDIEIKTEEPSDNEDPLS